MNNKKNWLWILENYDFTNYENAGEIAKKIFEIRKYNNILISVDEVFALAELINYQNVCLRMYELKKF